MSAPATLLLALALGSAPGDASEADPAAVQDLVVLAQGRPILLRLRVESGGRPFRPAWDDAGRALFDWLDRDGDGTLSAAEADPPALAALAGLAGGDAQAVLRSLPGSGDITAEGLAEALRPTLGPFRADSAPAVGPTDALFGHLDRDKDGRLTASELSAAAGSLRRLDLDDDEMIAEPELEPTRAAPAPMTPAAQARAAAAAGPTAVERGPDESTLRLARLLLRRYDAGRGPAPGPPDGRLSPEEFAIDPDAFDAADADGDGSLRLEELRRHLDAAPHDLALALAFPAGESGPPTARPDGEPAAGVRVRRVDEGDLEVLAGPLRLDVRLEPSAGPDAAGRASAAWFAAADANKDGYLDESELAPAAEGAPARTPLAGLLGVLDRDGDGKVYPAELDDLAGRLAGLAGARVVLSASDHGRALFAILDVDRDRRLGAREIRQAVERVRTWDLDRDGSVSAEEVPYHVRLTLGPGRLLAPGPADGPSTASASARRAGPDWFRKMDRNRDGDVSRREFLGSREQFDRLDRDRDGLLDPAEADAAGPP